MRDFTGEVELELLIPLELCCCLATGPLTLAGFGLSAIFFEAVDSFVEVLATFTDHVSYS